MSSRPLHVVVAVGPPPWPEGPVGLSDDVRLVKAALLYGDTATLASPAAALVGRLLRLEAATPGTAERLAALAAMSDDLDLGDWPRALAAAYAETRAASGAGRRAWIEAAADELWAEAQAALRQALDAGGHGELLHAVASGRLAVDGLGLDPLGDAADFAPVAADTFAERVLDAVASGLSVPMLDGATADLLRQRASGVAEPQAGWGRQGGLAADWLPRLPLFDEATVAETLDVRRELDAHVARFRAAVLDYADALAGAAWDADFPLDAERLFRQSVSPAVRDVADAVASTGPLRELVGRYADGPHRFAPLAAPALALGLSTPHWLVDAVGGAIGVGSAAANAAKAWTDARDKRREAEAHRLYFYYAAGERLRRAGR